MKSLVYLVAYFMPLFLSAQENGIKWVDGLSWNLVKAKAKAENKFIFVDCYATWCAPCKQMDKEVYPNERVGKIIDSQFISIKVQMDKTANDNESVKAWYLDAATMKELYKLEGFPSFLFFSPEGKLVHRALGLQNIDEFISMAKEALTDPIGRYKHEVSQFNMGQLAYSAMPELALISSKNKDRALSIRIAKAYKEGYLDHLDDKEAFTKNNLYLVAKFYRHLINSKDRYFHFFYSQGEEADQKIGIKVSNAIVTGIIIKEEITEKIYTDGNKPITNPKPDWENIYASITKKFNSNYAEKLLLDQQIVYYQSAEDWEKYVVYVENKIKRYPPKPGGTLFGPVYGDWTALNFYAWNLFLGCNNRKLLKKGVSWVDLAFECGGFGKAAEIDTKANLLYRMGKTKQAITLEEKAAEIDKRATDIHKTLEKMKKGEPTWLVPTPAI